MGAADVDGGGLETVEEDAGSLEVHLAGEDGVEDELKGHLDAVGVFEDREVPEVAVGIGAMGLAVGLGAPVSVEVAVDVVAECG